MEKNQTAPFLEIFTFGGLQLKCSGKPIKGLSSRKAEALLVYLAVTGIPQQREVLAELLWEERTQSLAQSNLRTVLTRLRKKLGAYLSIDRYTVEFKQDSNSWVDVNEFKDSLSQLNRTGGISSLETAAQVERAVDLYQGEFLEGFYIRECHSFENWLIKERERMRGLVIFHYQELIDFKISLRDYRSAIAMLKKLLLLDPLLESAHRQLMFLLFYEGQREAALEQFETCKQFLKEELDVEPSVETTALFEVILEEEQVNPSFAANLPELTPFFEQTAQSGPVFVGREDQLAQMEVHLAKAMKGKGRMILVSGEAGSGKTALVSEFARRSLEAHPNLLVASGRCNSFSGQGDAYYPLHQILETLCCVKTDEFPVAAERISEAFPQTLTTVLTKGPDLINRLIDPEKVMSMAFTAKGEEKDCLEPIKKLIESERENLKVHNSQFINDMCNGVLAELSIHYPLLIILDDLQWVDNASTNLLFDLMRKISDKRICMVGMYRPSEVFAEVGSQNPFEPLIYEAKTQFGETQVDLDSVSEHEAKDFVDAYLDSEPNQLDKGFRENLFAQTRGHPLFTIELLRTMQDRGDIQMVPNEGWMANSDLSWDKLPARVEGVIEARLARLDDWSREVLEVASVIGEEFDVHILSKVLNRDEREIHRILVKKLSDRHRLVMEIGVIQKANDNFSHFRFSHNLFQHYLYSGLGAEQQRLTHKAIANALELIAPDNINALAYHYSKTEDLEKAINYLIKVADKARHQYANQEAVEHYLQALAFIKETGDEELASRTWLKLALTYQNNFDFNSANQAYAKAFSLRTALSKSIRGQKRPPAPHPLHIVSDEPVTLDPTYCPEIISANIMEQLFSGLVTVSPRGNVLPDVARRWDVLDGGRRYVFQLRGDSFWTDSVPVTAGDFEFASKRALHPKGKSPIAVMHYDIRNARLYHTGKLSTPELIGIKTIDDYTLEFELENPTSYFLQLLGDPVFYPVPRHSVEAYGDNWTNVENFVSNGAFQLDSWVPGELLVLKKNPRYHSQYRGNLCSVEITFSNQVENCLQAYLDGDFDMLSDTYLTRDQLSYARQYLGDEYYSIPELSTAYVRFDTHSRPINDPRVRRAVALATDREALASQVFPWRWYTANGGFLPPGIPGHSPGIALPYDPDRARFLLAEAGFPEGKGFPVMEGVLYGNSWGPIANHLQKMWIENLRIQVKWIAVDPKDILQLLQGKKPLLGIGGWIAGYNDPHFFFVHGQWNRLADQEYLWDHQEYNSLIQNAKGVLNQDERINLYRRADQIIVEEAPVIPLGYGRTEGFQKSYVKGQIIRLGNSVNFKDVIIEEH